MKIIKEGGDRRFETDPTPAEYVADMLARLRRRGMVAHAITARVRVERFAASGQGEKRKARR